ncbi:hypothetical protein E2562_022357 [Oryza meyeriana var. granulata]|uniref:peroxidase n=1 Tax=Oryza meyeriana var. granulata TaxID=110450 RepID=A0A6G1DKV7_9ORYZ|nr:hypothetical protein E2562_022357 [Oryza meyeriana var. granulata]
MRVAKAALMVAVAVLGLATGGHAQLQSGFYKGKCGANDVEAVVQSVVRARFARDAPIVAHLLRMQFHECAVNVRAIAKLASSVSSDRRQSRASDVVLPPPENTAAQSVAFFGKLGLSPFDTVLLLGAHTVGVTHCSVIKNSRLYKYGGRVGATDPALDPYYAFVYKTWVCPNTAASDNNVVFLDDQWSTLRVDNNYYKLLQRHRGVLSADQNLYGDGSTRWIVDLLANSDLFHSLFPQALIKLGEVNVLTGAQGEIRKVCSKFN